ncbi:hypothetical protein HJFPF1_06804 [Paramyrothecium foliicola]|nr:hypothetical protein HJFPF1_06804 [Paramyrothecium foliicola]
MVPETSRSTNSDEDTPRPYRNRNVPLSPQSTFRRPSTGSSILSKLPFLRSSGEERLPRQSLGDDIVTTSARSLGDALQQQKTRRRRGSLRKVALLGRGAQRDRRDSKPLTVDTAQAAAYATSESTRQTPSTAIRHHESLEPRISDLTPRPSMDGYASRASLTSSSMSSLAGASTHDRDSEVVNSYNSTTDEEDILQIPSVAQGNRSGASASSNGDSFFGDRGPTIRRKSFHRAKSPLSYTGLAATPLPASDSAWDYSETSWWGWVVLSVTWFVFVIGMGSCLDIWSWAWDVGKTPYAPPELENDPTLPIVGYYPMLMILTCVMAWVWVVVAWVGMKYFRHAKISGD